MSRKFTFLGIAAIIVILHQLLLTKPEVVKIEAWQKPTPQIGIASWYGPGFHGLPTASTEIYDMFTLTAAHKTLAFGTILKVINPENKNSVIVRINDRGPFIENRIVDLSWKAASELGITETGIATVTLEILP